MLAEDSYDALHPLSELPHPLIAKASEAFGPDAADDHYVGPIASSTKVHLLEVRTSQWRGGVWPDPATGVCWLVVAGLAKGGHLDHDDFYVKLKREHDGGDPGRWLPTADDHRLLKRETAARLTTAWHLHTQEQVLGALREIHTGGSARIEIQHPVPDEGGFAQVTIEVVPIRDDGYEADEIEVEIAIMPKYAGSHLAWDFTLRVLVSLSPPEQEWDRLQDSYANIAEPGAWTTRVNELQLLVVAHELAQSEPGSHGHYTHRPHLAGSTIEGRAVRALCGVFFVPAQDHESLPRCTTCTVRYEELPG